MAESLKQLKFNCVPKLKSLLDKSCTSTLRKAYLSCIKDMNNNLHDKPCKYEVGDEVILFWTDKDTKIIHETLGEIDLPFGHCFGKVKIKKIQTLEIWKLKDYYGIDFIHADIINTSNVVKKALAHGEGFKSPEEMFKYIEQYAGDLTEPKPFWLIEWKWI